jgi:hypothetical protein
MSASAGLSQNIASYGVPVSGAAPSQVAAAAQDTAQSALIAGGSLFQTPSPYTPTQQLPPSFYGDKIRFGGFQMRA